MIIDVEQLVFEFRIYVQLDASDIDVRPTEGGVSMSAEPGPAAEVVDNFVESRASAYEWVDDRVFDASPDAWIPGPRSASPRSSPWRDSLKGE